MGLFGVYLWYYIIITFLFIFYLKRSLKERILPVKNKIRKVLARIVPILNKNNFNRYATLQYTRLHNTTLYYNRLQIPTTYNSPLHNTTQHNTTGRYIYP